MSDNELYMLGIIIAIILFHNIRKRWFNYRLQRKMKKARKAEKLAVRLLEKAGYTILEMQKRTAIATIVDGETFENHVQADFIVVKQGKRYVVEVKTGQLATRITNSATRRQLLEYYFVYRPHGVILLDMETNDLKHVTFKSCESLLPNYRFSVTQIIVLILGLITFVVLFKGGFK